MQAKFSGVPKVETRGAVRDQKASERRRNRIVIVDGSGGGENGVGLERNPIDVQFWG